MSIGDLALAGIKVLLIDDEPKGRELTQRLLTLYHAHVIVAATAMEGLERLLRLRPDVVVSDIDMPQMDGYQFIRAVRNLPAYKGGQTPAVAFTAFSRHEDRRNAINAGFQKYLSKPADFEELIDIIAAAALSD